MFGLPGGGGGIDTTSLLGMILYQNNGGLYQKTTYLSGLDSEEAINAFTFITDLFINFRLAYSYDILTRFRSGEMPLVITDFSFFNMLQVAAPEIRGLWDFYLVPGSGEDNNRSVMGAGLACMMVAETKKAMESWEFMKWWTSADVQIRYGREMENILGPSARVPTANIEAFSALPWSVKDAETINEQRKWVKAFESIPGGYFTGRHIQNAFRKVIFEKTEPRETLRDYVRVINKEIESKCNELKISVLREPEDGEGGT